jgi:hypothetical protein
MALLQRMLARSLRPGALRLMRVKRPPYLAASSFCKRPLGAPWIRNGNGPFLNFGVRCFMLFVCLLLAELLP